MGGGPKVDGPERKQCLHPSSDAYTFTKGYLKKKIHLKIVSSDVLK